MKNFQNFCSFLLQNIFLLFAHVNSLRYEAINCQKTTSDQKNSCNITSINKNIKFVEKNWQEKLTFLGTAISIDECSKLLCQNKTLYGLIMNGMCFSLRCSPICPKVEKGKGEIQSTIIKIETFQDTAKQFCNNTNVNSTQLKSIEKHHISGEYRIINEIIRPTESHVRPVLQNTDTMNLSFSLRPTQIIDIDELSESFTIGAWVTLKWTNHLVHWNKEDYENISRINVSPNIIWKPVMFLYNNPETDPSTRQNLGNQISKIVIENNGLCQWFSAIVFKASCAINVRYFPFDHQICTLRFGSWTEYVEKVDITTFQEKEFLEVYLINAEWELAAYNINKEYIAYDCCSGAFPEIVYNLYLKRRSFYFIYTLILPCGLMTGLVLLTFIVPPDSGERIKLGLTVLVAMTVYLNIASGQLPATSKQIPLLSQFYFMLLIQISLCVFCATLNLCIFYKHDPGPLPKYLRYIFIDNLGFLVSRKLSVKTAKQNKDHRDGKSMEMEMLTNDWNTEESLEWDITQETILSADDSYELTSMSPKKEMRQRINKGFTLEKEINEEIDSITSNYEDHDNTETYITEWQFVAAVIDRLLFILFLITLGFSTFAIFSRTEKELVRDWYSVTQS